MTDAQFSSLLSGVMVGFAIVGFLVHPFVGLAILALVALYHVPGIGAVVIMIALSVGGYMMSGMSGMFIALVLFAPALGALHGAVALLRWSVVTVRSLVS